MSNISFNFFDNKIFLYKDKSLTNFLNYDNISLTELKGSLIIFHFSSGQGTNLTIDLNDEDVAKKEFQKFSLIGFWDKKKF